MTQYRRKGGPRGFRGGANRRHWSQAMAGGVASLTARLARTSLRMRRTAKALTQRKFAKKKTDVIGTFVKCKDMPKRPLTYAKKKRITRKKNFKKAVTNVISQNLPRNLELNTFSWNLGGDNTTANGPDHCHWFQFAVNAINSGNDTTGGKGHSGWISSANASGANPAGYSQLFQVGTTAASPTAAVSFAENPTIDGIIADFGSTNVTNPGASLTKYLVGPSLMRYQIKNVAKYGGTLELFYVRPKSKIMNTAQNTALINPGHWTNSNKSGAQTFGNSRPNAYGGAVTQFGFTPLEMANYGYCRATSAGAGAEAGHLSNHSMAQLTDSKDFNDYFKIVWKCKAYVPPGGVIEKSIYERNNFVMTTEYLANYFSDSRTLYVVGRWIPEVSVINLNPTGVAPGYPQGDADATSVDLVGIVSYRQTVKQLASIAQYEYTTVRVNAPTGLATTGYSVSTNAKT